MRGNKPRMTTGHLKSCWLSAQKPMIYSSLKKDMETDNLVIGGGITGISTAYLLSRAGLKVTVVDSGAVASGETGRTTAHLSSWFEDEYSKIEKMYGREGARQAKESQDASIDFIEATAKKEKINCDFKRLDGYLFLDPTDTEQTLLDECELLESRGFDVELLNRAPLDFDTGLCIKYPNLARFHPLKYIAGLVKAIRKYGCEIYTGTHIQELGQNTASTESHVIRAKNIIIATNFPINGSGIYMKIGAYRTYALAATIPKGSVHDALYWDTGDQTKKPANAYHYIRLQEYNSREDLLLVGGEDHKTGQEEDERENFDELEIWAKERFPVKKVKNRWSGQILEPVDSLAYIGRVKGHPNHYMATGFSGFGMTNGTVAAMIISDLILGNENRWTEIYSPGRMSKGLGVMLKENLNVAKQYAIGWVGK